MASIVAGTIEGAGSPEGVTFRIIWHRSVNIIWHMSPVDMLGRGCHKLSNPTASPNSDAPRTILTRKPEHAQVSVIQGLLLKGAAGLADAQRWPAAGPGE